MNFYQRHIGDYLKDTSHLSLLEHGIYTRLLDVYYTKESGIPDDQAARLIGARGAELKALKAVLNEFFTLTDGIWIQRRCDSEIAKYHAKSEQAKHAALLSVESRQRKADAQRTLNGRSTKDGERTLSVPNNHDPDTNKQQATDVADPKEFIWSEALKFPGMTRSLLGKACKEHTEKEVVAAILKTKDHAPADPMTFFLACLKPEPDPAAGAK